MTQDVIVTQDLITGERMVWDCYRQCVAGPLSEREAMDLLGASADDVVTIDWRHIDPAEWRDPRNSARVLGFIEAWIA